MIYIFKDINKVVVTKKEQLEKMCCSFYSKLYKVGKLSLRQEKLRANAAKSIPRNYLQCDEFIFSKTNFIKGGSSSC
jgi:activator of 2-hydroxyglutaryl-CoA dehydratase